MSLIKNQNKALLYYLIIFSFFAFISPLADALFIFLCLMMVASPLIFKDNYLFCFWAFSACFMSCFKFQTIFLAMLDVSMVLFILTRIFKETSERKNFTYFILGFFAICFIYSCFVAKNTYKVSQSAGIILTIISFFFAKNISLKQIVICLSFGLIVSSTLSIISYLAKITSLTSLGISESSYFRFGAYFCNVNALALYCSLCQACLLGLLLAGQLNAKKWLWLLIVITLIGLASFSKTFILITFATYFVALLIGFIKSKNKKTYTICGSIILVIAIILSPILIKYAKIILGRFDYNSSGAEMVNSVTTGRLDVWKSYISKWSSSPLYILFGCGITAPNINNLTTHNFIISILYKFGIIGFTILIVSIIYILKHTKLTKNIFYYIPLFALFLNCLSEDLACSLYTCLPLLIAMLFVIKPRIENSK